MRQKKQFVFRHRWSSSELVIWDNRCLLNRADKNFDGAQWPRINEPNMFTRDANQLIPYF